MAKTIDKKISRISTACGPCRSRKARCDGRSPCQKCKEGDREQECVFIHRRGRYRKDQELQLSHAKDRAIKILFRACNARSGFPGEMPQNLKGQISSTTIMAALGIVSHREDGTVKILNGPENIEIKANELRSRPLSPQKDIDSEQNSPGERGFSTDSHSPKTPNDYPHPQAVASTVRETFYVNQSIDGPTRKARYIPDSNNEGLPLRREDSDAVSELDMGQQFRRLTKNPTYPNNMPRPPHLSNIEQEAAITPGHPIAHNTNVLPSSFWEGMELDLSATGSDQQKWSGSEFGSASLVNANMRPEQFGSSTNLQMPPEYYFHNHRSSW